MHFTVHKSDRESKLCPQWLTSSKCLYEVPSWAFFHNSILRPADTESALFPEREQQALPPVVRVDNNQAYLTIDYIMGHKPKTARSHEEAKKCLIKWEGYPLCEATKEPARNTQGCPSCCRRLLLEIHFSQIHNNHNRHTDHHLDSTHKIHHTRRYRIFSSLGFRLHNLNNHPLTITDRLHVEH